MAECVRAAPGSPAVLHFRVASPAPFARTALVSTLERDAVRVIDHGQVPADSTIGYAVVVGRAPGFHPVTIAGTTVDLLVADEPASQVTAGAPRIITPIDGAAAWGIIGVSVTWWRGDPRATSADAPKLHVSAGGAPVEPLSPAWTTTEADGPTGLAAYLLDTSALPAGAVRLAARWPDTPAAPADGAITLRVFNPGESELLAGECEAAYELPPLPEDRQEPKARIRKDKNASGGEFFDNAGATPRFRFPLTIADEQGPGWYQVILTAGGDKAAATLPTIGVTIDESQYPRTRSPIAMPGFHRTPVGLPVRLEPGLRVLRADFLNDFYAAGGADRNLRLDRIEVLRVADAGRGRDAGAAGGNSPEGAGEGAMMMMAAGPTGDAPMMAAAPKSDPGDGAMMTMSDSPESEPDDGWPASATIRASRGDPPVIALARGLHESVVCGDVEVRASAWWPGIGDRRTPAVRITLLLNGRPLGEQYAAAPRFSVPWTALERGENTIQLVADAPSFSLSSIEASVFADKDPPSPASGSMASPYHRFTVHDPRWNDAARERITTEQGPSERACFGLLSGGPIELRLPASLSGEFEIDLEARGQNFKGAAELTVSLLDSAGEPSTRTVGVMALPGGWDTIAVLEGVPSDKKRAPARLSLPVGPKTLRVEFTNDHYEPGVKDGDRNAFLQAVVLRAVADADQAGPEDPRGIDILHPADGTVVGAGRADALVIAPRGGWVPRTAEVLIDCRPTGQVVSLRGRNGPYVIPVSLRGIGEGEHHLSVRLTATGTRSFTSAAQRVRATAAGGATAYERAVLVLDRFGFGPDERELASILTLGAESYLRERLGASVDDPGVANGRALAAARFPNSSSGGDVQRRAILEAITTDNPVRARFVLWAQNHFSTWIRKTEARRKADEHERFTRLGIARFGDLLLASATSPAMLRYLDQEGSFARRLNENYAREIMELHTLGVNGGYTQEDVTTLARILTGWTTAREAFVAAGASEADADGVGPDEYGMRETFRYDPVLADGAPRTFLGRRFPATAPAERFDRVRTAIALLAGHPSTARFISDKIAAHYAGFPAPAALTERLAREFERSGGDMAGLLAALAADPSFASTTPASRLCHPPDFAFRLARCANSTDPYAIHDYLNLSGRGMFDRSTPDGYPENDAEQTDSNAMLQRWKLARRLEASLFDLVPPVRRYGDKPVGAEELQHTIDLVAMRLTGRLLQDRSNLAAIELFNATEGRREDRWRALVTFIASTPEAQLK